MMSAEDTICWMSHFDYISKVAPGFEIVAHTADCPVAAAENPAEKACMQSSSIRKCFTPKRERRCFTTLYAMSVGCAGDLAHGFVSWSITIKAIREKVGDGKVLLCTVRRCGFFGCSRTSFQSNRQPAHLRICRSRSSP